MSPAPPSLRAHARQPRVLVVDDDVDILRMVERYLNSLGYLVKTTNEPFGVLALLREETPDVVVLDLMIPGLNGGALAGFVAEHSNAHIVFFTASSEENLSALREKHPDAHVVKKGGPLTVLEESIRHAL